MEYKCINCGKIKENNERCMCPVCGYMMYELPNDRKTVIIGEIVQFVDNIIEQEIDVKKLDLGKLSSDIQRFPLYQTIMDYVKKSDKTETFYKRLKNSIVKIKQYFHETFRNSYTLNVKPLESISGNTAEFLERVMPELGLDVTFEKSVFPVISADYTETANHDLLDIADILLDRIDQLAEKMYKFIRANNIYGRAYDIETKPYKFKEKKEDIEWQKAIEERISACDKVINKKYVADLFEDGSAELTAMLKVTWDAVYVLMSAPMRIRTFIYSKKDNTANSGTVISEEMDSKACSEMLRSIYLERFKFVSEFVRTSDFLSDKTEDKLFELYNKILDFDIYHYMTGTKGLFVAGINEQKLDALIGLESIKTSIRKIKAYALANKDSTDLNLHMCFLGNPGTGKTKAARIIAGILHENGLLPTSHVIETDRSGLVAGYVGQTAMKTAEKINEAMGGVLFIDEAYSLIQGDSKGDYGHEAVSVLIKAMEDHRGEFCVILAGYKNQMNDLIATNPGFKSRIQFTLEFPNYDRRELAQITDIMMKNRNYSISEAAKDRILDITDYKRKDADFANAREIRNILDQVIMCQNVRCAGTNNRMIEIIDVNTYIKDSHINVPTSGDDIVKTILTAENELDSLVGLYSVKRMVKKIKAYAKRNKNDPDLNLHMSFCGNPGTGKTEVARILSRILYEAGVLPEAKLTETDSQGLISKYVGDTALKTLEKINDSMDGVLFIDEAYSLVRNDDNGSASYGYDAIAVLLKQMEDRRGEFCVILAGYKDEMSSFIGANPGLASRIQFTLEFPDYSREELSEIALKFLQKKKYEIQDDALELILDITEYYRARPNFANARTIRNILEQVIMNQNLRTEEEGFTDNKIIISDVEDYIDDENIDLNNKSDQTKKIGF